MDGKQIKSVPSLKSLLSLWLSLIIICVATITTGIAFYIIFEEGIEWQDDTLFQVAALLSEHTISTPNKYRYENLNYKGGVGPISVQFIDTDQPLKSTTNQDEIPLPENLSEGFQTIGINEGTYREFVRTISENEKVAVIQNTDERNETALEGAFLILIPILLLVPILIFVVIVGVRRILKPLEDVATDLEKRKDLELHLISYVNIPSEIQPFVIAINRLFSRIKISMDKQNRFVADAAHELRSPLTALSLQAERLGETKLSATAQKRLDTLRQGISRSRNLIEQLLAFSRIQSSPKLDPTSISLSHIIRLVLEDLIPLTESKNIDIGVVGNIEAQINANEVDITTLTKNLINNAIKYTPTSGKIDLSVYKMDEGIVFKVIDSGPGISEIDRDRVFDPFYRVLGNDEIGSGLGLSIVKLIAERVGATIRLEYSNKSSKTGLSVVVIFPYPSGNKRLS